MKNQKNKLTIQKQTQSKTEVKINQKLLFRNTGIPFWGISITIIIAPLRIPTKRRRLRNHG